MHVVSILCGFICFYGCNSFYIITSCENLYLLHVHSLFLNYLIVSDYSFSPTDVYTDIRDALLVYCTPLFEEITSSIDSFMDFMLVVFFLIIGSVVYSFFKQTRWVMSLSFKVVWIGELCVIVGLGIVGGNYLLISNYLVSPFLSWLDDDSEDEKSEDDFVEDVTAELSVNVDALTLGILVFFVGGLIKCQSLIIRCFIYYGLYMLILFGVGVEREESLGLFLGIELVRLSCILLREYLICKIN